MKKINCELIIDVTQDWRVIAGPPTKDGLHVDEDNCHDVTDDIMHIITKLSETGNTVVAKYDQDDIQLYSLCVKPIDTFDYLKLMM